MKIILNNKEEILELNEDKISVNKLLEIKKYSFPRLIVRINENLIKKENYNTTFIKDGDKVDIIHMISGG
ncbi:MAG: sulfur carrier protein ThiS [Stygiobacter sp.]|uniref:Sulfur carrier protein ThiS n=1 Tax=Stygiobacter electus TaxID=3032292 RepID=A0AAE3P3K1_9BACT|nr:sulfur carrier protein ThiS [Stygiobacter electus]MDF1612235.1 sulfur carrier protein ThiS [Stygiobacter electus]